MSDNDLRYNSERMIKEGDLFRVYRLGGKMFTVRYGYYTEAERSTETVCGVNLLPVFPDFAAEPEYSEEGYPFAVDIQEPCEHYRSEREDAPEDWCRDCRYFPADKPRLGLCACPTH